MKEMNPADNLILDFQPVELEGKSVVLFQRPSPQYSVCSPSRLTQRGTRGCQGAAEAAAVVSQVRTDSKPRKGLVWG